MANERPCSSQASSALIVLVAIAALANTSTANELASCADSPTTRCVLALATSAAADVGGERAKIGATLELALAQLAADDTEAALQGLTGGARIAEGIPPSVVSIDARLDLAQGFTAAADNVNALSQLAVAESELSSVPEPHKRADLAAKLAVALVGAGATQQGLEMASRLSEEDDVFAAYKARALHDIALILARSGDFPAALATIDSITMGISYYQSVVRSDVGYLALSNDRTEVGERLFAEARAIALDQDSGYFVAGALRQLADAQTRAGRVDRGKAGFERAAQAAREAPTAQERARAISRIVTSLADNGMTDRAPDLIAAALELAESEENPALLSWAHYEIAGSAAFAGLFDIALDVLDSIPADLEFSGVSLRNATLRDVAWGLARRGRATEAIELAASIDTARERTQAFARIVRAIANPGMRALPRYL